jgi:hypothetical protein
MNDADKLDRALQLVNDVFTATAELEALFEGRHFTPDGHLVGSLGEVIAAHRYGLILNNASEKGHDAVAPDGRKVEVKLTSIGRVALRHEPEHLLVLVRSGDGTVSTIYNGPGKPVWEAVSKVQSNGQRSISVAALRRLDRDVPDEDRLPLATG